MIEKKYDNLKISNRTIFQLYIIAFSNIILPIIITIVYIIKSEAPIFPCIIGILTFFIFAKNLEAIPHYFFIIKENGISKLITNSTFLYVLYGISMAGIFEETGRYISFKYILKNYINFKSCISFGLAYAGFESILVIGITYIYLIYLSKQINKGKLNDINNKYNNNKYTLKQINTTIEIIINMNYIKCFLTIFERIIAMIIHISLTIIVFKSVISNNIIYYIYAIIIHASFDIAPALYQRKVISLELTEFILFIYTIIFIYYTYDIYTDIEYITE